MTDIATLEAFNASRMQRRFVRLVGRGTTALYVALRALALRDGPGEVILPDIICSNVLDAMLLAGFTPIFADVTPHRFAIDPESVYRLITPSTRAVIIAHLFGYISPIHDYGVPIIEDAVQGLGGNGVGTRGTISFTSFNETKMIGGQGGAVATDDEDLFDAIQQVNLEFNEFHKPISSPSLLARRGSGGEVNRYNHYMHQLIAMRQRLIPPFDDRSENVERIHAGWEALASNAAERNRKAQYLRDKLTDLPLDLPEICSADSIWRYSFTAPNHATANWILRHLQLAGLSGSNLYPSLSNIFAADQSLTSQSFAPNIINLWVDAETDQIHLDRAIKIIRSTPWSRLGVSD